MGPVFIKRVSMESGAIKTLTLYMNIELQRFSLEQSQLEWLSGYFSRNLICQHAWQRNVGQLCSEVYKSQLGRTQFYISPIKWVLTVLGATFVSKMLSRPRQIVTGHTAQQVLYSPSAIRWKLWKWCTQTCAWLSIRCVQLHYLSLFDPVRSANSHWMLPPTRTLLQDQHEVMNLQVKPSSQSAVQYRNKALLKVLDIFQSVPSSLLAARWKNNLLAISTSCWCQKKTAINCQTRES